MPVIDVGWVTEVAPTGPSRAPGASRRFKHRLGDWPVVALSPGIEPMCRGDFSRPRASIKGMPVIGVGWATEVAPTGPSRARRISAVQASARWLAGGGSFSGDRADV